MIEDELLAMIDAVLRPIGSVPDVGEDYREPPLDVLRYAIRPVRLHRVPILGRALSVVAVARQPIDVGIAGDGYTRLLKRLAMAVNGRYPPWRWDRGLAIGLTAVVLTPEPIGAEDDGALKKALAN